MYFYRRKLRKIVRTNINYPLIILHMPIITLTTDYGHKDYFVAALKGNILSQIPEAQIVDVSHTISPFNIIEGAYILKNAYQHFPKGTVHLIDVDSARMKDHPHIALEIDGHYFIGPDNGLFALMFNAVKPTKIVALNIEPQKMENQIFPMLNIFITAACHIGRGGKLAVIGREIKSFKIVRDTEVSISPDGKSIVGKVIYVDHFGNVVTNITQKIFNDNRKARNFTIESPRFAPIHKINTNYQGVGEGELLALFNSAGYLEIAISRFDHNERGGASLIFGLKFRDNIKINFS